MKEVITNDPLSTLLGQIYLAFKRLIDLKGLRRFPKSYYFSLCYRKKVCFKEGSLGLKGGFLTKAIGTEPATNSQIKTAERYLPDKIKDVFQIFLFHPSFARYLRPLTRSWHWPRKRLWVTNPLGCLTAPFHLFHKLRLLISSTPLTI